MLNIVNYFEYLRSSFVVLHNKNCVHFHFFIVLNVLLAIIIKSIIFKLYFFLSYGFFIIILVSYLSYG